jgi:hypothetical protein
MAGDRFLYLFKCYKLNRLSDQEWHDWRVMITAERHKAAIELDIESCMHQFLLDRFRQMEAEERTWETIFTAIRQKL